MSVEGRQSFAYLPVAIFLYLLSLVIPPGALAFSFALTTIQGLSLKPFELGKLLLALSWLANPVIWVAMILFGTGRARWAALAAEAAVLLALCAVRLGWMMPAYSLWIASMLIVVFASLSDSSTVTNDPLDSPLPANPAQPLPPRQAAIIRHAITFPLTAGLLIVTLFLVGEAAIPSTPDVFDPNRNVRTGDEARAEILRWSGVNANDKQDESFLKSATSVWYYEGGNFNGSIIYWVIDFENQEDCDQAFKELFGLSTNSLKTWVPSRYAVVMEGPRFYVGRSSRSRPLREDPWDVGEIKNGLFAEFVDGDDHRMIYHAIDLDRHRIYYHYESGGFPTDVYPPSRE